MDPNLLRCDPELQVTHAEQFRACTYVGSSVKHHHKSPILETGTNRNETTRVVTAPSHAVGREIRNQPYQCYRSHPPLYLQPDSNTRL